MRTISCSSISLRTISSRKNGLPSARSRMRSRRPSPQVVDVQQQPHEPLAPRPRPAGRAPGWRALRGRRPRPGRRASARAGCGQRNSTGAGTPVGELLQQVEHRAVGPVDVLEHRDRRAASARAAKKPRQASVISAITARGGMVAQRRRRSRRRPMRVGDRRAARRGPPSSAAPWPATSPGRLSSTPSSPLSDLGERPEGDAVAVRQAASRGGRAPAAGSPLGAPRPAGSCRRPARRRSSPDAAGARGDAARSAAQQLELAVAADQRRAQARRSRGRGSSRSRPA